MQIYYYCSYEGSPSGYHIGKIQVDSCTHELQELNNDKIHPFIRQCFEDGRIRAGFGKLPERDGNQQKYFLLKKKLNATRNGIKYYINFAIVTKIQAEFEKLMLKEGTEKEIINYFLESIEPDKLFYFGYRIRTEKIQKLSSCGYGKMFAYAKQDWIKKIEQNSALFIETATENTDEEIKELEEKLELIEKNMERRITKKEKLLCYKKKIGTSSSDDSDERSVGDCCHNVSGDSVSGTGRALKEEAKKLGKKLKDKLFNQE